MKTQAEFDAKDAREAEWERSVQQHAAEAESARAARRAAIAAQPHAVRDAIARWTAVPASLREPSQEHA